MGTNGEAFTPEGDAELALLEAELAVLISSLEALKIALAALLESMQMQHALELGAPQAGDQTVRWN